MSRHNDVPAHPVQSIEDNVQNEKSPQEPQRDVREVAVSEEGIKERQVVACRKVDGAQPVQKNGQCNGCRTVEEEERHEQLFHLLVDENVKTAVCLEEKTGKEEVERHAQGIQIEVYVCLHAEMKPHDKQNAQPFGKVEIPDATCSTRL